MLRLKMSDGLPFRRAKRLLPGMALLTVGLLSTARIPAAEPTVLSFAGYQWTTRAEQGMPGPNRFSPGNAFVDADGALHLRASRRPNGRWACAEVLCGQSVGFGTFEFEVAGPPLATLDPNVVLGMFTYPTDAVGPDGTNEIDIELSRWGVWSNPVLSWTVYPVVLALGQKARTPPATFSSAVTFHRFVWSKDGVSFSDYDAPTPDPARLVASWDYRPSKPARRIAQQPMQLMINLWFNEGRAPADGKDVEFRILHFRYTPAPD